MRISAKLRLITYEDSRYAAQVNALTAPCSLILLYFDIPKFLSSLVYSAMNLIELLTGFDAFF